MRILSDSSRGLLAVWVLLGLPAGCSNAPQVVSVDSVEDARADGQADDGSEGPDTPDMVRFVDLAQQETDQATPWDWLADLDIDASAEIPGPKCEPGQGCFLDPCTENAQCLSGWCVEHTGDGVCTIPCQEECPGGWTCKQVAGTEPDVVFICVSEQANLCRPCAAQSDCKSLGGQEETCLDYGEEGGFCGGACGQGQECPLGFSCVAAVTVEGLGTTSCVSDSGLCPCTGKSIALSLWTHCEAVSEFGSCSGKRVCKEGGLSACDAPEPVKESCNGEDDDCDGETDEPDLFEGEYLNLCDDGNPCTKDSCKGKDGCQAAPLSDVPCDDGDACTAEDECLEGACAGETVDCDDSNLCTDDACSALSGCVHDYNWSDCDDDDPCTAGDSCKKGVCSGEPIPCECTTDDDCKALEDGDLCNGTLACDLDAVPHKCFVVPDTVIACPPPAGLGSECLVATCDPKTGVCDTVAGPNGKACDDGDACTYGVKCLAGACAGGKPLNCNDDNPCTDDGCDAATGCTHAANSSGCDDTNVCTVGDICADSICLSGTQPLSCDDANLCTVDTCSPKAGCVHETQSCDDGNPCTLDTCLPGTGQCLHISIQAACGPCEVSICDPGTGKAACVPRYCDDKNACTMDSCNPAAGVDGECVHMPIGCGDGNLCTDDSCDPQKGCLQLANQLPCDDGNACTVGDTCAGGTCGSGVLLSCDDSNLCTVDNCEPDKGCVHKPKCGECGTKCVIEVCDPATGVSKFLSKCDDQNKCTLDSCAIETGQCSHKPVDCSDGNPCTDDACDSDAGCTHMPSSASCDDGNACTTQDKCSAGQCTGGLMVDCDDDNPCTKDSCVPATGCMHQTVDLPCSDGDLCTTGDACVEGKCTPSGLLACDDGNLCTIDSCNPATGCTHTPNTAACDDSDACTVGDTCGGGACVPGAEELPCNDGNPCTDDSCDPATGCVTTPNKAPCDDSDTCTVGDVCSGGTCQPGPAALPCNDGNPCTDDSCAPATGCLQVPNSAACDDGAPCTVGDACAGGLCVPGASQSCDDGNSCTKDSCAQGGCTHAWSGPCTVQPGPAEGMDHVIGSVYNIDPNGTMDHIRTGGWGDNYWALLQFPLDKLPPTAKTATIRLFGMSDNNSPTSMYLDRVTSQWAENCTWSQKPSYANLTTIPPSQVGVWYEIVVTDLYNGWKAGTWPNYGVQFRSLGTWNNYNGFWSSDYTDDPTLRPMLVVVPLE